MWGVYRLPTDAHTMTGITKAQRELTFITAPGIGINPSVNFIDSGESLSIVNRKLFSQKKVYGIERIEFVFAPTYDIVSGLPNFDKVSISVTNCLDTWPVHNGWVKGKALHDEMLALVLEDNPSIKGKWSEFKVYLDPEHQAHPAGNITPLDSAGNFYLNGEWQYSKYVLPEHSVDAAGNPLPADETEAHLLGADVKTAGGEWISVGLVNAYQESRARVTRSPDVPPGMSDSFFNQLTDSGSQEPELADVIEADGDLPPYDVANYPGGVGNGGAPSFTDLTIVNQNSPNGVLNGFLAPCGLFRVSAQASLAGDRVDTPGIFIRVTYAPGMYKGVAAIDMGQ